MFAKYLLLALFVVGGLSDATAQTRSRVGNTMQISEQMSELLPVKNGTTADKEMKGWAEITVAAIAPNSHNSSIY